MLSIPGSLELKFPFGSSVFFVLLVLDPIVIVFLFMLVNFVTHCSFICVFVCMFVYLFVTTSFSATSSGLVSCHLASIL